MKCYLIQEDSEGSLISKSKVDIKDTKSILSNIHYYDVKYGPNKREILSWLKSGEYKKKSLSISGDSDGCLEDGFDTETMYLSIVFIK